MCRGPADFQLVLKAISPFHNILEPSMKTALWAGSTDAGTSPTKAILMPSEHQRGTASTQAFVKSDVTSLSSCPNLPPQLNCQHTITEHTSKRTTVESITLCSILLLCHRLVSVLMSPGPLVVGAQSKCRIGDGLAWASALNPSIKEMSKSIITRDKEGLPTEKLNISEEEPVQPEAILLC